MNWPVRLDKFLADAGTGTRSELKKFIKKGYTEVNGIVERHPEKKIHKEDRVTLNGRDIKAPDEFVYYLLNKPSGYVSATEDRTDKTVLELVPKGRKGLFPVGRLDKDTEGLLLITDDGGLAHMLLSPRHHVDKTYFVKASGCLKEAQIKELETGVDIGEDKLTLPARAEIISVKKDAAEKKQEMAYTELLLTIHEGKYHQIKRMLKAVGSEVIYLKRISMGIWKLPEDLKSGEYLEIPESQMKKFKEEAKKKDNNRK